MLSQSGIYNCKSGMGNTVRCGRRASSLAHLAGVWASRTTEHVRLLRLARRAGARLARRTVEDAFRRAHGMRFQEFAIPRSHRRVCRMGRAVSETHQIFFLRRRRTMGFARALPILRSTLESQSFQTCQLVSHHSFLTNSCPPHTPPNSHPKTRVVRRSTPGRTASVMQR
jgi:hypothetical protein